MRSFVPLCLTLLLMAGVMDTSPILTAKQANQLLRSKRSDRQLKAGFPDEPMREYLLYLQGLQRRADEQQLEHWLNPHCKPHCNSNWVSPI
ncbi:uncharacterized protein C17orf67 homolog [Callorhinchus milii]|uniref:Chromosome 17 open reading frame 67 n=1 Tax=Callorhinchus milii TaxID=7868 RepID=A0A4W3HAI2_CALMI|nr:uncharacterized protein C17orf67 homolog [Callorhinchus milii]|eukprot:gi/632985681/ref/XP_007909820.1/ PREDICTED: uncharacterized protein C17orf67 homolog [Callorhinchus milii]